MRGRAARHGARSREPPHHGLKHVFWAPIVGCATLAAERRQGQGCTTEPQGCHLGTWRSLGAPRTTTDSWGGKAPRRHGGQVIKAIHSAEMHAMQFDGYSRQMQ